MTVRDEWRWTDERGAERRGGADELRTALASGRIAPSTLVWHKRLKDWTPASAVPEMASAVVASRMARPAVSDSKSPPRPLTSKPPGPASPRKETPRPAQQTLLGLAEPMEPPSSAPAAPIVVPSADGQSGPPRAVITQIPRYGANEPKVEAPAIPRAPKLPASEKPKRKLTTRDIDDLWAMGGEEEEAPKPVAIEEAAKPREPTVSAVDAMWASPVDDDAPTESWEHALPLPPGMQEDRDEEIAKSTSSKPVAELLKPVVEAPKPTPEPPKRAPEPPKRVPAPPKRAPAPPKRGLDALKRVPEAPKRPPAPPKRQTAPAAAPAPEPAPAAEPALVSTLSGIAPEQALPAAEPSPVVGNSGNTLAGLPPPPHLPEPSAVKISVLIPDETTAVLAQSQETTDLLPSSHLIASAPQAAIASPVDPPTETLPLPPPAIPRLPLAAVIPRSAPTSSTPHASDDKALNTPVSVPMASLLGAGGALIVMVVGAFFVGRCSATEEPIVAHSVFQAVPALARAALPPPLKPCWVSRQPVKWAPEVARNVPFDVTATGAGTLAIGYARDAKEAVGVEVELATGAFNERFAQKIPDEVERVTPIQGEGFSVTSASSRGKLSSSLLVATADPFVIGVKDDKLVIADKNGASPSPLWPVTIKDGLSAARAQPTPDRGYGLILRDKGAIYSGWIGPDRKPVGDLVKVAGSGGSVGKPNSGWNTREYAVIFADRPANSDTWEIRVGHAPTGSVPSETEVIPLPKGGPGGDAFAPDITGLSDGRWLMVWTEGASGRRAVRAQTYAPDWSPLGDPIALSPPAGNFGQGVLGMVGNYASVVFLSKGDSSYELWGAVLQCG